jgi:hypothetical protein
MSEAAPGNPRNIAAAGRDRRREDQADGIANPAGRVFVENRPFDIRPIQRASGPCHCARQRGAFLTRQSAEKRRRGKGGGVRITRVSLRQRFDEMRDLACVKAPRRRACGG